MGKKTQHSSRKTCALVPNTVCVIICYLYHHSDSLWERHGCVHSVVSRCTLTNPFTSNTLLPIKTIIIPGLLQAPKISVMQLSAPLCSEAWKGSEPLPYFLHWFCTLVLEGRGLNKLPQHPSVSVNSLCLNSCQSHLCIVSALMSIQ